MKSATTTLCLLLAASAYTAKAQTAKEQTTVKVLSLTETRRVDMNTDKKRRFSSFGNKSGVKVELELIGPVVAKAIKFGNIKVTGGTDDKGTDLKPKEEGRFSSSNLQDINRKFMYFHEKEIPQNKMKIEVEFGLPARDAKSISFTGTVDLLAGKKVDVSTVWSALKPGQKVESPVLTEAGVTLEVVKVSDKKLDIKATGSLDAIAKVDIVDAEGKSLKGSSGWSGWNNTRTYNLHAKSSFGTGASLVVTVLKGKKTVSVPISAKKVILK